MPAPRVTTAGALEAHPSAFEHAVLLHCLNHILRAGGCIPTGIGQIRRKHHLIRPNKKDKDGFHGPLSPNGGILFFVLIFKDPP